MVYPPASARHERAGRMMIFFSHQFSPQRASRRLSSAALLRTRNRFTMASPLSALHMKASGSCKIQVLNHNFIRLGLTRAKTLQTASRFPRETPFFNPNFSFYRIPCWKDEIFPGIFTICVPWNSRQRPTLNADGRSFLIFSNRSGVQANKSS